MHAHMHALLYQRWILHSIEHYMHGYFSLDRQECDRADLLQEKSLKQNLAEITELIAIVFWFG